MKKNQIIYLVFDLNCGHQKVQPWNALHRHNEVELTFFITQKPVIYLFGGQKIQIYPDDTLLFWGAVPHQLLEVEEKNLQYWLTIPPEIFVQWDLPSPLISKIMEGEILVERNRILRKLDLVSFPLWEKEAKVKTQDIRKTLVLSFQARLRRFGNIDLSKSDFCNITFRYPYSISPKKDSFDLLYNYIVQHFRERLTVKKIASHAKIHPNYAVTLFHQKFGISIVDFITMLRIFEAQRLILTTNKKVIDIALESGFRTVSHFYKCFHKYCKKNPKEYRKELWIE